MNTVTTFLPKAYIGHSSPRITSVMWSRLLKDNIFGSTAIWGAGAKGATFCNVVDPDCKWIRFVVDITPEKQGKFIPGTGHPIVSYMALKDVDTVLLMNPNYHDENQLMLDEAGIEARLIDV